MHFHRRKFLTTSLTGLAAASFGRSLLGEDSADKGAKPADKPAVEKLEPPPFLPFLTWWTDPTTTMVVQWVGAPEEGESQLEYAPRDGSVWRTAAIAKTPFPGTDLVVHRCELTGLSPGTEHHFRTSEKSPKYRFRTMPAKATDVIQFVSGGDAGTGSAAVATNILAAKQEPHFAFIGGDLAYDNGKAPKIVLAFLENYSRHMIDPQGRLIPLLSCLGNHEVNGGYKGKRESAPHYMALFDGFYRETSYGVLDIGDYLSLVLLDTNHMSAIEGAQTDWLASTLADRQDRPHLIVANHVPAYPSHRDPANTGEGNRRHWSPLFEKFNVDVVLEHHDHTFKRTHPLSGGHHDANGVLYLGDGSWGKLRSVTKPENRPYLAAWSSAYHVSVHRLEGKQRFHVALADSGRVADVCATYSKRPAKRG